MGPYLCIKIQRGNGQRSNKDLTPFEEEPPLGIILCAGKKQEQIELLELDKSGIHVAEYMTELPSRDLLKQKLKEAIASARAQLEHKIKK